jgi:hypothetical protein
MGFSGIGGDRRPLAGSGRELPIAPHHLIVRFLRNENRFPHSGHSHAALHEAVPDPERTQDISVLFPMIQYLCNMILMKRNPKICNIENLPSNLLVYFG